jgi:class 3 adenylate cyclase
MGKREIIPDKDTGESQKPASWFVSMTLASGPDLPTGTVTFLFTDIEGSTPYWERHPDLMQESLKLHNEILFRAIQTNQGKVFKIVGDEFQAVFTTAPRALRAALGDERFEQLSKEGHSMTYEQALVLAQQVLSE